jgi:hypothetical protein
MGAGGVAEADELIRRPDCDATFNADTTARKRSRGSLLIVKWSIPDLPFWLLYSAAKKR